MLPLHTRAMQSFFALSFLQDDCALANFCSRASLYAATMFFNILSAFAKVVLRVESKFERMSDKNEYFVPINEVAKRLDVPAYNLRYWEKQFPSAVRPVTGAGNRRYYRIETVEKLETIKSLLYDKGMTIAGVKKILHNGTFNAESNIAKRPANAGEKRIEISPLNMGDIDSVITLLNQAKSFLD